MTNSKHSQKYEASREKIAVMLLFHRTVSFPMTGEKDVDDVFIGFDSDKKIVAWFD